MRLAYCDLQTPRLRLRRPRPGDAPEVFESFGSDVDVTRFLTWAPHEVVADAEAALAERLARLAAGTEYSWILEGPSAPVVAGLISLWLDSDGAEVGFVLARRHWNLGLMTEALRAVTAWAWTSPAVTRIWATCDVENMGSGRVLEKAGFVGQGVFARRIVWPNLGPEPRPSLLFTAERPRV
jgi:RimJ/RimL family protein N-acetyltransferase